MYRKFLKFSTEKKDCAEFFELRTSRGRSERSWRFLLEISHDGPQEDTVITRKLSWDYSFKDISERSSTVGSVLLRGHISRNAALLYVKSSGLKKTSRRLVSPEASLFLCAECPGQGRQTIHVFPTTEFYALNWPYTCVIVVSWRAMMYALGLQVRCSKMMQ